MPVTFLQISGPGTGVMVNQMKKAVIALDLTNHVNNSTIARKLIEDTAISVDFMMTDIKVSAQKLFLTQSHSFQSMLSTFKITKMCY